MILLCLHGWGTRASTSFDELREELADSNIEFLAPDLPGFGSEPEPDRPWSVDDYADWVEKYMKDHVQGEYALLGHSHGGRICLKLANRGSKHGKLPIANCQLPKRLFLCAAAGIRHPRHFKRIIGLTLAKCGKALLSVPGLHLLQPIGKKLLYKLIRVHDYEKATPLMQQTLLLVSKEDLRPFLKSITIPTDIFWGTDDGMTPYSDAAIMAAEIEDNRLHTYVGARHGVHRERAEEIAKVIRERLRAIS